MKKVFIVKRNDEVRVCANLKSAMRVYSEFYNEIISVCEIIFEDNSREDYRFCSLRSKCGNNHKLELKDIPLIEV